MFPLPLRLALLASPFLQLPNVAAQDAAANVQMVASSWFAGWHASSDVTPSYGVSDIPWDKYTEVIYAFAVSSDDANHIKLEDSDKPLLKSFVKAARQNGVKPILAYGGWGGSRYFSYAFTSANRTATVKAILRMVKDYDLDGIDFDWEYPGRQGIGCNVVNSADTNNFLAALQLLRADPVGAKLQFTSAVASPYTFSGSGSLSDFGKVLDYIEIMNYDINGQWSNAMGPNAPLNDTCASNPDFQQGSAVSLVKKWSSGGFPKERIVLGVAGYGHSYFIPKSVVKSGNDLTRYPSFDKGRSTGPALADSWGLDEYPDVCGVVTPAGGTINYWGLKTTGFLDKKGDPKDGIVHAFDSCSQTDYVYNPKTQVAVSYDSPRAFAAKGSFIKSQGLRGFAMWEMGGDSEDQLIDAIRGSAGFGTQSCHVDTTSQTTISRKKKRSADGKTKRHANKAKRTTSSD